MRTGSDPAAEPLPPLGRLTWLVAAWALYLASGPGVLLGAGSPLGFLGVAAWAHAARRPGRGRFALELLVGGLALAAEVYWIAYVYWPPLVLIALGFGLYAAFGGALLRRLSRRLRPALAVPLAWIAWETLRRLPPEPLGFSWLALGHRGVATPLLAGSARLWSEVGIGYALAALAGLAAELWEEGRRGRRPAPAAFAAGLAPLALALLAGLLLPVPQSQPGPRVLCVQPAFDQARKMAARDPADLFEEQHAWTRLALERASEAPDLVCWGETMLPLYLAAPGVAEEAAELEVDAWLTLPPGGLPELLGRMEQWKRYWVGERIFGLGAASPLLPSGTAFAAGAVVLVAHEGRLRRTNSLALWGSGFEWRGFASKQALVPGAETLLGLERLDGARAFIQEVSGYVPDFLGARSTEVLRFEGRDGRSHVFGGTVCYDNAFLYPYLQPLRAGELDFHLVVSNEAWYLRSFEVDQMLAFSRLACIASGRSMVRATNSGITSAFGPDGRELGRLTVEGQDRLVPGTLLVEVPVPRSEAGGRAPRPPAVWLDPWWRALAILLPLLLSFAPRRGGYSRPRAT